MIDYRDVFRQKKILSRSGNGRWAVLAYCDSPWVEMIELDTGERESFGIGGLVSQEYIVTPDAEELDPREVSLATEKKIVDKTFLAKLIEESQETVLHNSLHALFQGSGRPKRDIQFVAKGQLAVSLGIDLDRAMEIERFVGNLIDKGGSLQNVVESLNERGDLNDSEWTAAIFALGVHNGRLGG